MISMKSKTDFHNARVVKEDGTHTVKAGDAFKTDWIHAKDLIAGGLAEPVNPKDLETEPTEALTPHSSLSQPDLDRINRQRAAKGAQAAKATGVAGGTGATGGTGAPGGTGAAGVAKV